jgi:hypothetical protein
MLAFAVGIVTGLSVRGSARDVRSLLLASAIAQDPDFPEGKDVQLVRFAYIGALDTPSGPVHVAERLVVITGMLAPHVRRSLDFFDRNYGFLASHWWPSGNPLWCEGSKLYLDGEALEGPIPVDPSVRKLFDDDCPRGNVIDMSEGFGKAVLRLEKRYGSSGGIEDDPLADLQARARERIGK